MPAQGNPTPPLVGGNSVREPILQGHVFQSGIHKPEHSSLLTYKYPQYYMTTLLDKIGAYEGIAQDTWSWNVLDRTRESGTVSSVTGNTTATATFEVTEFDFSGANLGYLIVGDVVRLESGALGRVTVTEASTVLSGKQKVTVVKTDGTAWTAAELADGFKFGHVFSLFGEGSEAPDGRLYLPTEEYNVLSITRRSVKITGSEFTNKTYLSDNKSWYWEVEDIMTKEHARDREGIIMFGERNDSGIKLSRGILDYVETDGVLQTYAGSTGVTESDFQAILQKFLVEGSSNELVALCGSKFLADANVALRDYAVAGAQDYGKFGDNMAGLDFKCYNFLGKKIYFAYYELFDDEAMVPYSGTASATKINFSDFALILDFGTDSSNNSLIKLKYKVLDGQSRKFIYGIEKGMMSPQGENGGFVASGFDGFKVHVLSELGIEVRLAHRMGIMRANS